MSLYTVLLKLEALSVCLALVIPTIGAAGDSGQYYGQPVPDLNAVLSGSELPHSELFDRVSGRYRAHEREMTDDRESDHSELFDSVSARYRAHESELTGDDESDLEKPSAGSASEGKGDNPSTSQGAEGTSGDSSDLDKGNSDEDRSDFEDAAGGEREVTVIGDHREVIHQVVDADGKVISSESDVPRETPPEVAPSGEHRTTPEDIRDDGGGDD